MKCRDQNGFTLIETLVAITIFAFAVLGLAAGTVSVIQTNKTSHLQASAVNLAQGKIEEFRAMSTAAIAALACPSYTSSGCSDAPSASGKTFSRSWQITANLPVTGVSTFAVKVDWSDYSSRSLTMSASVVQ
jgi:prepilin-type N-terminal cleavage/methylation domain-containing protein